MTNVLFIIAGLFGIGLLIGFHELGHFIFCKIFQISTPSFSIGFGPRIFSKKIGDTEFSLSAIPLGGYVEMAGSAEVGQGEQKHAHAKDKYSFAVKPYWQKLLVMLGGIMFNLIFAYGTFFLLFATGVPKSEFLQAYNSVPVIEKVIEGSAAEKAGIVAGDTIIAVNNTQLEGSIKNLFQVIKPLAGQHVLLTVEKERGNTRRLTVTLDSQEILGKKVGSLGVVFKMVDLPAASFSESIKKAVEVTNGYISMTANAFKHIFSKKDTSQMAGPLMIISATAKGAERGIKIFFIFLAIISINLAILNLIPLPILDGGQILFYTIEAVIRRPLPESVRYYIHLASWVGIMILIVYLSFKDISRIFCS